MPVKSDMYIKSAGTYTMPQAMFELRCKFVDDTARAIYGGKPPQYATYGSVGFDLMNVEEIVIEHDRQFFLVRLGVIMSPPAGCHIEIVPRSSTYKRYGLVQPNSIGVIDQDYIGDDDELLWPAVVVGCSRTATTVIPAGTRLCQGIVRLTHIYHPVLSDWTSESRGGHGSTGT